MTMKCHHRMLQTNPKYNEETQSTDSHTTARTQLKESNQLSRPQQDYCKAARLQGTIKTVITKTRTKHKSTKEALPWNGQ